MTNTKTRLQKYSAPALEKGLDILELLSLRSGKGMNQSEIAEGIGRSKNEIFRMMVVLEERGYIRRGDGDTFFLEPKFGDLTARRNETARMLEVARPFMVGLSQQTSLSNHLWIIENNKMQVAAMVRASDSYSLALSEGTQSLIIGSSAGACFLSAISDPALKREKLHEMGEFPTDDTYADFDRSVKQCAVDGFCVMPNQTTNDILEVSAPLMVENRSNTVAALTVPMISGQNISNNLSDVTEKLRATVERIRARLTLLSVYQSA